jgi:hypothetical protein
MHSSRPRFLLIGAGKFGSQHLRVLQNLEKKRLLTIKGIIVKTEKSRKVLSKKISIPVYTEISDDLLDSVDAAIIATSAETHFELIKKCLPRVHVFVEKPISINETEALALRSYARSFPKKVLMVGHIYRFHPVSIYLKKIIKDKIHELPKSIEGTYVNPISTDTGKDIETEMLHLYDIIDYVFNLGLVRKQVEVKNRLAIASILYKKNVHAVLKMGWSGNVKKRELKLSFKNKQILCDFVNNTVSIFENGLIQEQKVCKEDHEPIEKELRFFISQIKSNKKTEYPDAALGYKIISIAKQNQISQEFIIKEKKKIAVIGGGIFGANCAIELSPRYDVTIFERNPQILSEASYINQYRVHSGYHYPRSQETVDDIRASVPDFEERYSSAIITEFPTYYTIAKKGSKTSPEDYLRFCDRNNLPYTIETPSKELIDTTKISLSIKTYESIYNYEKVKSRTEDLLRKKNIKVRKSSEVLDAKILSNGKKALSFSKAGKLHKEEFDYVINATYAYHNNFCSWLGFPRKPIRIDLVEALWIKLDIPKISLAVMDGPFTNIVPMSKEGMFTLVHIKESVLRRFVPKDGLVPEDIFSKNIKSKKEKIISESMNWFPILKSAKVVERHLVLRGVEANREYDDARISGITEHGFGCYSILGGKVINAVSTAKKIANTINGITI